MQSELEWPVNLGCPRYAFVNELATIAAEVAAKKARIKYIDGPIGAQSRDFSKDRIHSTGWQATIFLKDGMSLTYPWIDKQVMSAQTVSWEDNSDWKVTRQGYRFGLSTIRVVMPVCRLEWGRTLCIWSKQRRYRSLEIVPR